MLPTPADASEREVTNSASYCPSESCIQTTPKHPTLPSQNNIFRYPTHRNTASRKLPWGITKLGAVTRYSGIEYEVILLDCGLSCDYDTAEKGRAEAVEEGEFGNALGNWIGSGEEYGVLSEFCRCRVFLIRYCGSDNVVRSQGVIGDLV